MSFSATKEIEMQVISFKSQAVDDRSQEGSLSGRVATPLPADLKYRIQWKNLGVAWIGTLSGNPFFANALLPKGWSFKDAPNRYSDRIDRMLLDENGLPRVRVFIKSTTYEKIANAFFLTNREGKIQLQKDFQREKEKEVIISQRVGTWSKECPFGVFFVTDISIFAPWNKTKIIKNFCHGYFPTKEIANKAVEHLVENAEFSDIVFSEKVDSWKLQLIAEDKYEVVNGLINENWLDEAAGFLG